MATVELSDFTIYSRKNGEFEGLLLESPATMDSGDTVALDTILFGRKVTNLSGWDTTTGDSVTATFAGNTVTVDVGGGGTNLVYVLKLDMLRTD